MVPWLLEMQAERLVLELREILVRCDENLKADTLLRECVPYFLDEEHPAVDRARRDQAAMVAHVREGPEAYAAYYATNAHERPFEEQYHMQPVDAHQYLPRVAVLRAELDARAKKNGRMPHLADLSCNDGWMAANLAGQVEYRGIDLNPDCIERARERKVPNAQFKCGPAEQAEDILGDAYDYVVAFEVLEHVHDPDELMRVIKGMLCPGGRALISTPWGAVEHGDLPTWWHVEPKGHVRVYTPRSFTELLSKYGPAMVLPMPDGTMVATMTPAIVGTDDGAELQADGANRRGAARTPPDEAQR